jgi:hypothetical protein
MWISGSPLLKKQFNPIVCAEAFMLLSMRSAKALAKS